MLDITNLLITIALIIGAALVQVWLSNFESWIPGLALPLIFFAISIINVVGLVKDPAQTRGAFLASIFADFVLLNIPTLILLGIYFLIRRKKKIKYNIDKSKFNDL